MPCEEILQPKGTIVTSPRVPNKGQHQLTVIPSTKNHVFTTPTASNLGHKTTPTPAYHRYPLCSRSPLATDISSVTSPYAAANAHVESTERMTTAQDTDLLMNSVVHKDAGI